jgi:NADPH-dependent curcumin reductase CurA
MRGRMSGQKTYVDPYTLGEPIQGSCVASVVESKSNRFRTGDLVGFIGEWSELQIRDAAHVRPMIEGIDPETALSICGLNGLTAYFGLLKVGALKEGEVVCVTAAAGATGYLVGSIAKIYKCKVIGLAGSDEKISFLKEVGFDECLNYKKDNLREELKRAAPDGINVFFDNVGGDTADLIRENMAVHGRVVQCGSISTYNAGSKAQVGPRVEHTVVFKRLRIEGFIVHDFHDKFDEALQQLAKWYKEGKLKKQIFLQRGGLTAGPRAFSAMMHGENIGKTLVKI